MSEIIEKIKKLLALAASTNVHEASNAAAAANKLIQEYRISDAELETEEEKIVTEFVVEETIRVISWKSNLIAALVHNYSCCTYQTYRDGHVAYAIVGIERDIETVKYMYTWIVVEIVRLSHIMGLNGKREFNSFYLGAVEGIKAAMSVVNQSVRDQFKNSNALVKLSIRLERAEDAMPSNLRTVKRQSHYSRDAFDVGKMAGQSIHSKTLEQGRTKLLGN